MSVGVQGVAKMPSPPRVIRRTAVVRLGGY